jgi:hypothetical protein
MTQAGRITVYKKRKVMICTGMLKTGTAAQSK